MRVPVLWHFCIFLLWIIICLAVKTDSIIGNGTSCWDLFHRMHFTNTYLPEGRGPQSMMQPGAEALVLSLATQHLLAFWSSLSPVVNVVVRTILRRPRESTGVLGRASPCWKWFGCNFCSSSLFDSKSLLSSYVGRRKFISKSKAFSYMMWQYRKYGVASVLNVGHISRPHGHNL